MLAGNRCPFRRCCHRNHCQLCQCMWHLPMALPHHRLWHQNTSAHRRHSCTCPHRKGRCQHRRTGRLARSRQSRPPWPGCSHCLHYRKCLKYRLWHLNRSVRHRHSCTCPHRTGRCQDHHTAGLSTTRPNHRPLYRCSRCPFRHISLWRRGRWCHRRRRSLLEPHSDRRDDPGCRSHHCHCRCSMTERQHSRRRRNQCLRRSHRHGRFHTPHQRPGLRNYGHRRSRRHRWTQGHSPHIHSVAR